MTNEFKHNDKVDEAGKLPVERLGRLEGLSGKLLAFDTATGAMSVAVLANGQVEAEATSMVERNHSVYLTPAIDEIMNEAQTGACGLTGIAVGRGPGSYTGVRIGVTTAKTMAWALGIPVAGVSTLEALAAGALAAWLGAPPAQELPEGTVLRKVWVVPLLNARRGQAFTGLYELQAAGDIRQAVDTRLWPVAEQGWSCRREDAILPVERWVEDILELARTSAEQPDAVLFAGETGEFTAAIERFEGSADWRASGEAGVATGNLVHHVSARYIGYLGALRLAAGLADETHTLLPNYTQLTEAEVNYNAKNRHGE